MKHLTTLAILASVATGHSALVNVNFNAGTIVQTESALDGPGGGANSTWNQSTEETGTALLDSSGLVTTIGYTLPHNLEENDTFSFPDPERVMQIGSFGQFGKGEDTTLTITGLVAGNLYNVWIAATRLRDEGTEQSHGIFSTTNATTSGSQVVDGITAINGNEWVLGTNYAFFANVEADTEGNIAFLADATDADELFAGSDARRFHINGFQIAPVPEPSAALLGGLGLLALLRRRR